MSIQYSAEAFANIADRIETGPHTVIVDRSFGLPSALYVTTFTLYLAFLGVMTIGFGTREMAIPLAICVVFLVMAFSVPRLWAKMGPVNASTPLRWSLYQQEGIQTYTGRVKARDANAQVLILPVLILFWGVAVVSIAAMV
jgi:hypothetical protein